MVLNDDGWQALAHGQDIGLTAVEFQLLRVMMQAPGRIFSREQLMDHMYRDNRIVSERTVDSHIKKTAQEDPRSASRTGNHPLGIWRRL
ncbi:hypothetical protein HSBAA_51070 [Vreelandella sulfidaeris]|uniref:OmpR/PhoB-type domain-containing protein n=1 Tax=Vreelandella sulfidaeris TaxID=115553 RepID=A0A455UGM9_9GAMM|nr:hypothetical protein HSBAA_51070 [Halomonas sulfidaeris]